MSGTRTRLLAVTGAAGLLLIGAGCGSSDGPDPTAAAPETAPVATTPETSPPETTAVEPKPTKPTVVTVKIVVNDGRAVGGIVRPRVKKGQKLTLVVTADVADHVHLHGYDKMVDVVPGRPAKLPFTATIPGRFEVELEDSGVQIAEVEVRP
jgi:hypothetical protein